MRAIPTVLLSILCASYTPCQDIAETPEPVPEEQTKAPWPFAGCAELEVTVRDDGLATVVRAPASFFGYVLLSTSPAQTQFPGLPLILSEHVVVGSGWANDGELELWSPGPLRWGVRKLYGQAIAFDGTGVWVSGIVTIDIQ